MRILLVNPYITDFTAFDLWLRPLGLLYIAAVIREYTDCQVFWLDTLDRFQDGVGEQPDELGRGKFPRTFVPKPGIYRPVPRNYARYGIPAEHFFDRLENLPEMDLILITSLMTYWIDGLQFTLQALKKRFPQAKTVLGGILPGLLPIEILKRQIGADYFISGHGEAGVLKLIAGLGGRVSPHPDFCQPDRLPFPAFDLLGNRTALPLLTSRGCPYRCSYCASHRLNERFQERSPARVLAEMTAMQERFGTQHFILFDDALLVNKERRFRQIFSRPREETGLTFHTPNGMHPGEIDRSTAEMLFLSGFQTLRLSFESTSADILEKSNRKVTVTQMIQAVDNLEKAGFRRQDIGVYLLAGFPGQEAAAIEQAILFAADLGVVPHLAYFSPVPASQDFIELQRSGLLSTPVDLYETNKIYFLYCKSGLSFEEIANIKALATKVARRAQA